MYFDIATLSDEMQDYDLLEVSFNLFHLFSFELLLPVFKIFSSHTYNM